MVQWLSHCMYGTWHHILNAGLKSQLLGSPSSFVPMRTQRVIAHIPEPLPLVGRLGLSPRLLLGFWLLQAFRRVNQQMEGQVLFQIICI